MYQYLLKPKASGIALALSVLGINLILCWILRLFYPDSFIPTFWGFLSGKVRRSTVRMSSIEIPPHFPNMDYEATRNSKPSFSSGCRICG